MNNEWGVPLSWFVMTYPIKTDYRLGKEFGRGAELSMIIPNSCKTEYKAKKELVPGCCLANWYFVGGKDDGYAILSSVQLKQF